MNAIIKHIPNSITCLNLLSGCLSSVYAFNGDYKMGAIFIALAAVFDFLDGFFARLLHAYSPLGKELDSLADLISFGMAPAVLMYSYLLSSPISQGDSFISQYIPYTAFLITIFSGLRLAKFNIDTRQTTSFIGLPVPANALFWIGMYWIMIENNLNDYFLLALFIIFSYLMVSEIPMFSLKFKNLSFKENYIRYLLIICTVLLIIWLGIGGLAATVALYILLSLLTARR